MFNILLVFAVVTLAVTVDTRSDTANSIDTLTEDDLKEDFFRELPKQRITKRGWWGRRSSNKCASTICSGISHTFEVYTCPLDLSGKKCDKKRGLFGIYIPYGVKHTYIKIENMCYDWGNWNYARKVDCDHPSISCCTSRGTRKYTGTTNCASRIGDFQTAWEYRNKNYNLLTWNCQKYTDSMKDFLIKCCATAGDAIKSRK